MKKKLISLFLVIAMLIGCLPSVVWAATGNDIANAAWNYLGVSRDVYDCSAFTQKVYADCGISIPRLTYDQANCGTRIYSRDVNDLKPGDIICFGSSDNSSNISHVGIYVGNNVVLHSSYSKWQIAQDNMSNWITTGWYSPPYQFAVRVVSGDTTPIAAPTVTTTKSTYSYGSTVTVNWNSISGAAGYNIYMAGKKTGVTSFNTTDTSWNAKLEPDTYTLWVNAFTDTEWKVSNAVIFTVNNHISAPCATSSKSVYSYGDEVRIDWNYVEGATGYNIYMAGEKTGATSFYINDTSWVSKLEPDTYTLWVNSYTDTEWVASSAVIFTVMSEEQELTADYPFTITKYSNTAVITNNTTEQKKATVIIAEYNNNILSDTEISTAYIAPEIPLEINVKDNYKVFVWDSLEGMKPLAEQ